MFSFDQRQIVLGMGAGVPRNVMLRSRSERYLVPADRHRGEAGDFFVRATCDSIAGAHDSTPRGLDIGGSGAGTSRFPATGCGRHGSRNGAPLQQSCHRRHRRLIALGLPPIHRFSPHDQTLIAISGAFGREGLRASRGGQHG